VPVAPSSASPERLPLLRFGEFELDRTGRELRRSGQRIRLQIQPLEVLALLLERAGQIVTRDDLRGRLWPSSVYVDFDHGLNNAIARLREALGDTAAAPQYIETIPRIGYRLVCPVATVPQSAPAQPVAPKRIFLRSGLLRVTLAVAPVGIGLMFALWLATRPAGQPPSSGSAQPSGSLAVLPLVNMSSDPDSEHFADGLTEELIDKLASIRGLKVIGQTSSFYYKGKHEPLPRIAKALNVGNVLEGNVQRAGTRLRVTVQLVAASDGSHLWSETFDRSFADVFQIQEEIATAVAARLQLRLQVADERRLRSRGTPDAEAYRLYVLANAYQRGLSVARDVATAKQLYERAIARDPRFAAAYAGLARIYFGRAWTSLVNDPQEMQLGLAAAERALALDPGSSAALQARANYSMWRYRFLDDFAAYVQACSDYRRAIQLDPANQTALFDYGRAQLWHDPSIAKGLFERLGELEPLAIPARAMAATAMDLRGQRAAASERLKELADGVFCCQANYALYRAAEEQRFGNLDEAALGLREAQQRGGLEMPVWLWSVYMSLGDRAAAEDSLNFGDTDVARTLRDAAALLMRGRPDAALARIDSFRDRAGQERLLDLPASRLALIAGKPAHALMILQQRLPDVYSGVEPISARNVLPALDLAAAWKSTGEQPKSRQLLVRIAAYLDAPSAPQVPLFIYQRARAYALADEPDRAFQALDRAYTAGFRDRWAPDLHPQPLLYIDPIDADPAFAGLRSQPRYRRWLARLTADAARQLARLRSSDAAQKARRLARQ
jgi:TolB-like protein/DNA-binding winged helix-turn-helix (wHTH) protein